MCKIFAPSSIVIREVFVRRSSMQIFMKDAARWSINAVFFLFICSGVSWSNAGLEAGAGRCGNTFYVLPGQKNYSCQILYKIAIKSFHITVFLIYGPLIQIVFYNGVLFAIGHLAKKIKYPRSLLWSWYMLPKIQGHRREKM